MIVPKQFDSIEDLQAMIISAILGTLTALKDDILSLEQAKRYWFNDSTSSIFEELNFPEELINIVEDGCKLLNTNNYPDIFDNKLDEIIIECKNILSKLYDEKEHEVIKIDYQTIVN